jgi:hypothetical protein
MSHAIHRVTQFEIVGPHILNLAFEDATEQRIDFRPVLKGVLFGPLQDLALFNAVALDPEAGTLTWPNGADFDPAMLHDWPNVCNELVARAHQWSEVASTTQSRANEQMEPTRR